MDEQVNNSLNNLVDKLESWINSFILNLPNIVLAILIFGLAYFLSQKLNSFLSKILRKKIQQDSVRSLIANVTALSVVALGLVLALGILNLDKAMSSILAGAGVAGLAIGLALQGTISNTFSGIFLAVKDILNIGDFVETNGYNGTVESINLRYVKIREGDNNMVIIPNKMVVENPFKNYGLTRKIRTTINCGVGYDSDLRFVKKVAMEEIEKLFPQGEKELEFQYLEFGDSSINFQMRFWVEATMNLTLLESKSEAIIVLKERFDKEGIDIPYPIRTLYMPNYDNKKKATISSSEN